MDIITQLRKPRIHITEDLNISVFDTLDTVVIAYGFAKYMDWNPYLTVGLSFPVAYLSHKIFMIETALTSKIDNTWNS